MPYMPYMVQKKKSAAGGNSTAYKKIEVKW